MRNLDLAFVKCSASQKKGEDLAKFCDVLRIYEIYTSHWTGDQNVFRCLLILTLRNRKRKKNLSRTANSEDLAAILCLI